MLTFFRAHSLMALRTMLGMKEKKRNSSASAAYLGEYRFFFCPAVLAVADQWWGTRKSGVQYAEQLRFAQP